jgi:WhiB family redox-sensing transcriptional regulator
VPSYHRRGTAPPFDRREDLACRRRGVDPDWWFAEADSAELGRAVRICHTCPVRLECAEFAVQERVPFGVYGGWTPAERSWIRKRREGSVP